MALSSPSANQIRYLLLRDLSSDRGGYQDQVLGSIGGSAGSGHMASGGGVYHYPEIDANDAGKPY
jgi:hypothetical protein